VRYLLDTNVLSELRKRPEVADARVVAWAAAQDVEDLHLSVISVMEIELGVARLERRDARQGAELRRWFENAVIGDLAGQILPVSLAVARRVALLQVPDPRPLHDAYIAATGLVHGLPVATRNTADFDSTGVPLVNPWETGGAGGDGRTGR